MPWDGANTWSAQSLVPLGYLGGCFLCAVRPQWAWNKAVPQGWAWPCQGCTCVRVCVCMRVRAHMLHTPSRWEAGLSS